MVRVDDSPRWLSEREQQGWIGAVALMWELQGPLEAQVQRDWGLTLFEYFVLSRLSMADAHRLRMSDLADLASARPSRLSNVVARLEARGWVRRETDPTDRRGTVASLTEAGFALVVEAAPTHVAAVRRLVIDRLTPEQVDALAEIGAAVRGAVLEERCAARASGETDC